MRAEDDALTFLWRRRDLLLRLDACLDVSLAGQPPRVAEVDDVVFNDVRAVPVSGSCARLGSSRSMERSCGRKAELGDKGPRLRFGMSRDCSGSGMREEEEQSKGRGGHASQSRPLLPLLIALGYEAEGTGSGIVGLTVPMTP